MKKIFCCFLALVLILGAFAGCKKQNTPPTESTGAHQAENTEATNTTQTEHTESPANPTEKKAFQVVVVHKDGTTKELSLETEAEYLGAALLTAGVVEAEENLFGMHIKKADGEKAVFEEDCAYWAVYIGENFATKSTDLTPVEQDKVYKLVYTEPTPKKDTDDSVSYLFDNLFWPIALGQVGTNWDTVTAFAQRCGYMYVEDEGTYDIHDPNNRNIWFGGDLTSITGCAELATAEYRVYIDEKNYRYAGVYCRGTKRENPTYRINGNIYNNTFEEVGSLAEVEAYIKSHG